MLAGLLGRCWDGRVRSWGGGHWTVSPHRDASPRIPEAGRWWPDCHVLFFSSAAAFAGSCEV